MNAVFERDFVRTSLAARWQAVRAAFAALLALVVGILALGAYASGDFSEVGTRVLWTSVVFGLALVLLLAPGAFGTSLVHARAQNALPVLFASPLTALQVAWGAFASRALLFSVFVFACWPPVALSLAFGGVRPVQLVLATAAVLAALLLVAAPSFAISAVARSTGPAVVGSYLAAASVFAGLTALGAAVGTSSPFLATCISPFAAIDAAMDARRASAPEASGAWVLLLLAGCAAAGSVLLAAARLRWEASGGVDAAVAATAARGYRPLVHENPVLDRELRTGGAMRTRTAGRNLTAVLVAAEIAYALAAWHGEAGDSIPLFAGFLLFHTTILVLAAAAAGATSLAGERESGTIDVLRVTPLRPAEIVRGKVLGLFRAMLPALAVPCLHLAWGAAAGVVSPLAIPAYLVAGGVVSCTWIVVGIQQSLDQRTPHRAVLRTMGALVIVAFALAGYAGVVLRTVASGVEEWVRWPAAFGANPAAAALVWVAGLRTGGSDAETTNLPPPGSDSVVAAFAAGAVWLTLHVLAAGLVYRGLARLYRTRFEG